MTSTNPSNPQDSRPMFIVITGNPVDGLEFFGPYADSEDIDGDKFSQDYGEWWIAELKAQA